MMLDNNFFGLLESQIEALRNADAKESNIVLLETAKLLLSRIDTSAELISSCDKFEIRELFAAYSDVATGATEFYEQNKNVLDPAALSGKIGQNIATASAEIVSVKSNLNLIKENEEKLLEQESLLCNLKKEYEILSGKITELKQVRDTMTPEILEKMRSDIKYYEAEIVTLGKEYEELKNELNALTERYSEISNTFEDAVLEKNQLGEKLIDVISSNYENLQMLFNVRNMDANKIVAKIREYQELYERLENEISQNADTLSYYEMHLGENSKIVESMKKYGVKSLESALDDVVRIKKTIDEDLSAYDLILQKILLHEEDIRKGIERRQGKKV